MNAFRKRSNLSAYHPSGSAPMVTVPVSKTVVTKDNPEPTTYVEMKTQTVDDYAKSLGLPRDEDYQLRDMIAAGRIPEEVPVSGILDSNDPTDLSNVGRGDAVFGRLAADVDSRSQKQLSKPVSEPAPTPEPPASN
jgi:hypothetical protein